MIDPVAVVLLLGVGTWSALDGTSIGQVLVSRPIVSSCLAGWILGDPASALLVGVLLEGSFLGDLPAGGARLPEPGPAAIPAVLAAAQIGGSAGLAVGIGLGMVWSVLGGATVTGLRYLNGAVTRRLTPDSSASEISRVHWTCVGLDAARGLVLTASGGALAFAVPPAVSDRWDLPMPLTVALLALPGVVAAGAIVRTWMPSVQRALMFAFGLGAGLTFAVIF